MIKYLVTICLMLLLYTNSALAMPPIMTTSELKPGMQGYAETVVQGAQQVSFNVEIIGVVNNGKGSSKQILARAYGPIIEETNGVIHGMSGSPVYVDGKLIGAVARAVGQDVLPYKFYITPIEEMLKIWTLPDPLAVINKSNIEKVKIPSLEEYEKAIQTKSIILFTASWCPDCMFIKPFIGNVVKKYPNFTFYSINRDYFIDLCQDLDILGIPSFVSYENGQETGRFVSKLRKTQEEIETFIQSIK